MNVPLGLSLIKSIFTYFILFSGSTTSEQVTRGEQQGNNKLFKNLILLSPFYENFKFLKSETNLKRAVSVPLYTLVVKTNKKTKIIRKYEKYFSKNGFFKIHLIANIKLG